MQQIDQALATAEADPQAKIAGSLVAQRVQQLQAAAAAETGGVHIIRPASVPGSPASPKVLTSIVVGFIAALILAVAAVFGLEAVDRRLLGGAQFEAAFGAPVLGAIPSGRRRRDRVALHAARRKAYSDLAARLAFTSVAEDSCAIMISPASKLESAGAVALGLAEALGVLGQRVVLLDADLGGQPPRYANGSDERGGLTSVLVGVQVVGQRDPQPLALRLQHVAEGDRLAGHPQRHEGRGQGLVGVDQRAVEIEHRDQGHASV